MSALVMGLVWEQPILDEFGRPEKYLLLAYADHADQNGNNIFPSVELISKKTGYEERSVQSITRKLEKLGYLVDRGMGPHGTNRFSIPLARTQGGAKITPHAMQKIAPEGIAPEGIAPEPSVVDVLVVVNADFGEICKAYEQEFGALTPMIADAIRDSVDTYPAEWIPEAMQIAVQANKRSWNYVEGILKNCKAKNLRPSLNRLEKLHANGNAGNSKRAGQSKPATARTTKYSDADRAAADAINQQR